VENDLRSLSKYLRGDCVAIVKRKFISLKLLPISSIFYGAWHYDRAEQVAVNKLIVRTVWAADDQEEWAAAIHLEVKSLLSGGTLV